MILTYLATIFIFDGLNKMLQTFMTNVDNYSDITIYGDGLCGFAASVGCYSFFPLQN